MNRVAGVLGVVAIAAGAAGPLESSPQSSRVSVGDMEIAWEFAREDEDPLVTFTISAPTTGWLAIGFARHDAIVGAELVMMRLEPSGAHAENHWVTAAGRHPRVEAVGLESRIVAVAGSRRGDRTELRVALRQHAGGADRLALTPGSSLVLIAAWSVAPEFDHHSRVRRHVPITLEGTGTTR